MKVLYLESGCCCQLLAVSGRQGCFDFVFSGFLQTPVPADDSAVPPAAAKQDGAAAPTHGSSPVAIAGGASFNDAPEIASGTTYTDTIVTGENRYFRIPLQWGQRFTYLLTPTGPAQPAARSGPPARPRLRRADR